MYLYPKILLILLLSFFTHSREIFVKKENLNLGHITLFESYCKNITSSQKLCKSKKLSYIDYDDVNLPAFLQKIKEPISPIVQKYEADNLKANTLKDIEAFHSEISGNWSYENSIDFFAKTSTTYTLSTLSSGYEGGAHGYYYEGYDTYTIQTNKKLTLDDLFVADYNQTLHHIAQKHYKKLNALAPNQPLTNDGWFEDKFILAENFAITPRGLYFFYNQYEIKPYALGTTAFMLPYSKIRHIINPKGALGFALEKGYAIDAYFEEKEEISLEITTQKQVGGKIKVIAKMKNLSYLNHGWLSLSFPQLSTNASKNKLENVGFSNLHTYPKGSKIYHHTLKKAIRSSYLLVEGEDNQWKHDKINTITLTLTPPPNQKELILDIRGNLKSKTDMLMLPNRYKGTTGQQGFTNYRVFIDL